MKVVDIHPEELIDKLAEGTLTLAERERLDAHLRQCSSCRFESAVRSDLASDTPAFEERPQLTFPASEQAQRALVAQREPLAAPPSLSVRPRSRHRWALSLLAAALVLCAGGAMAAVINGAVSSHWLGWSPASQPDSSVHLSESKPTAKPKRAAAAPHSSPAPASEPVASGAAPVAAAFPPAPVAAQNPAPAPVAAPSLAPVVNPSVPAVTRSRRVEAVPVAQATLAASDEARTPAFAAPVSTAGPAEAPATRLSPAAALFADANRARRDGNADRAVSLYRSLQSRYPSSSESELSRAMLAQLLLERGNPEAALAGFDRYLAADAPVLSAEALVGRARALEQLGKASEAAAAWRQVQSRFPGSVHARLAATRLAALGMR